MGNEDTQSNILVAIKVRPLISKEENSGDYSIVRVEDNLIVIFSLFKNRIFYVNNSQ